MGHDIYLDKAVYSLRKPMWHKLGYVSDKPLSIDQVLEVTDTDYEYELTPLTTTVLTESGVATLPVDNKKAVIRIHPRTQATSYVGIVGDRYKVHGARALDRFNNALLDAGVHIETYGLLGERGERMFLTYRLPNTVTVAGSDPINSYLFASTSFDGNRSTEFRTTSVRVVCANTFAYAKARTNTLGRIRHTSLLEGRIAAVRDALEISFAQLAEYAELADDLNAIPMRREDIDTFLKVTFPLPPEGKTTRGETIAMNKRTAVKDLLQSPTNAPYADTAWGVFNAYTEWLDHEARANTDMIRLSKVLDGQADASKAEAASLLLAGV